MIEGNKFIEKVKSYFHFLLTEFGYNTNEEKIYGNSFYDVRYKNENTLISISYENIEDFFLVMIFTLQNGVLPDYDDKSYAKNLNELNANILPNIDKDDLMANNEYFSTFTVTDQLQKRLLKSAKELRLCLKYPDKNK